MARLITEIQPGEARAEPMVWVKARDRYRVDGREVLSDEYTFPVKGAEAIRAIEAEAGRRPE